MTLTFESYEEELERLTGKIQKWLGGGTVQGNNNKHDEPSDLLSKCEILIRKMKIEARQQLNPEKQTLLSRLELYMVQLHSLQRHCPSSSEASDKVLLLETLPEKDKKGRLFSDLASQLAWIADAKETTTTEERNIKEETRLHKNTVSNAAPNWLVKPTKQKMNIRDQNISSEISSSSEKKKHNFFHRVMKSDGVSLNNNNSKRNNHNNNTKETMIEQRQPSTFLSTGTATTTVFFNNAAARLVEFSNNIPFNASSRVKNTHEDDDCWSAADGDDPILTEIRELKQMGKKLRRNY